MASEPVWQVQHGSTVLFLDGKMAGWILGGSPNSWLLYACPKPNAKSEWKRTKGTIDAAKAALLEMVNK